MQERVRMEQMQAYIRQKPVKEERGHQEGTLPSEEKSVPSSGEWTEKDAREWARYDAVSDPRGRNRLGSRSEGAKFAFPSLFQYNRRVFCL